MKNLKDKLHENGPKDAKRVVYKCKKCGWTASILAAWSDLKPKRCGNRKCRWFFLKFPQDLLVEKPKVEEKAKETVETVKKKVKITKKNAIEDVETLKTIKNDEQQLKFGTTKIRKSEKSY